MTTGSFINNLMQDAITPAPEVGMGATMISWTDREPATIIEVSKSGKKITIQTDIATRTDDHGMSDAQSYTFERNPKAYATEYSLRKNGRWVRVGDSMTGSSLLVGQRSKYYDFSF